MTWADLIAIARTIDATVEKDRVLIDGAVVARLVEPDVVAFAVSDDARERLLATEPFFINDRFRALPVVLAQLAKLDRAAARVRFGAPEAPAPAAESARCYWLALWSGGAPAGELPLRERRRFLRYTAPSLLDWFAEGWQIVKAGDWEDWPPKLRGEERGDFSTMFSRVFDDGEPMPKTPDEILARIRRSLDGDAEPHFIHGLTDDDEGTHVEYFMFDDTFLETPDVLDRLPHPDRGGKRDDVDDRYRTLIEKLAKRR